MPETKLSLIFERYEILGQPSKGSFRVVHKALNLKLDRIVALKILLPSMQNDDESLERFKREARVLAKLDHPHVVRVYDAEIKQGLPYLIMEFVEGKDLEQARRASGSEVAGAGDARGREPWR